MGTPETDYWTTKYDLKGCSADKTLTMDGRMVEPVRKRFYRADMWCTCAWTEKRWEYKRGKDMAQKLELPFPKEQRSEILDIIARDVDWLVGQGLLDYSLLMALQRHPADAQQTGPPPGHHGAPR